MADLVTMGSVAFEREMMNNPRDDESSVIKEKDFHIVDNIPRLNATEWDRIVIGVDPSVGESKKGDYIGVVVTIVDKKHNYYVIEIQNKRLSFLERIRLITNLYKKYKRRLPVTIIVEAISEFRSFSQMLITQSGLPIIELKSVKNKIARLESVSPFFENRKLFWLSSCANLQEAKNQCINNEPKYDDIRDAIVSILEQDTGLPDADIAEMVAQQAKQMAAQTEAEAIQYY